MLNPASPTSASCLDPTPENLCFPPKKGDYVYFETPPFQAGEPPTVILSRAADASMLAYARFVQQRMTLADLEGILAAAGYLGVQPIGDCFVDGANTGRNPAYCNVIAAAARTRACYRVVDNLDIVTHVPPDLLNFYAHPSIAIYWVDPGRTLRINPPSLPNDRDAIAELADGFLTTHWMEGLPNPLSEPLADHSPVRYAQYIGLFT